VAQAGSVCFGPLWTLSSIPATQYFGSNKKKGKTDQLTEKNRENSFHHLEMI